jgi:hypothetical protein
MAGGLMQLVAYGAQDVYLTGNPQTSFFNVVFRRHTNFSMEHIQQTFAGNPGPDKRVVATISRNGDLVHDCYLKFEEIDDYRFADRNDEVYTNYSIGYINNIDVKIGGQLIDRHHGDFLEAWSELTEKNYGATEASLYDGDGDGDNDVDASEVNTGNFRIGDPNNYYSSYQINTLSGGVMVLEPDENIAKNFYLPLRFWFCKDIGSSLPLISLQYHEVDIIINFSGIYALDNFIDDVNLWANYIYLDTDERRRFAQVSHEYLIEQVQRQDFTVPENPTDLRCKLKLNHPVKELIWVIRKDKWGENKGTKPQMLSFSFDTNSLFVIPYTINTEVRLILNGHDRFEKQTIDYFTRYQPYKYHENLSRSLLIDTIAVYSFALKPEEHQPSGTCNFSRINTSILEITNLNTGDSSMNSESILTVFAINYNVLRIMSGMGGLAYSN